MKRHPFLLTFRTVFATSPSTCTQCLHHRTYRTATRLLAASQQQQQQTPLSPSAAPARTPGAPRPAGAPANREPIPRPKRGDEFKPQPLGRPIGFAQPPRGGENDGVDERSWKQRKQDFVDYDKHIERRKDLTRQISKPYFRDFSNMRFEKGKSFLANPKMFKAEAALYFPNFRGMTLEKGDNVKDTTPVLRGKISVVTVFSSVWGEEQTKTFVGTKQNPQVQELLEQGKDVAQRVDINIEENVVKFWLISMFASGMRKKMPESQQGKYFVVQKGVSETIRETIGLLNSKVGYVFLLDEQCKIRWAGSADAHDVEKEYLVQHLRKLIADSQAAGRPIKHAAADAAATS